MVSLLVKVVALFLCPFVFPKCQLVYYISNVQETEQMIFTERTKLLS